MKNALYDNKIKCNSMKNSEKEFKKLKCVDALSVQYILSNVEKPTRCQSCLFSVLQVSCITREEESCGKTQGT